MRQGERKAWFRLALTLHKTLFEVQDQTSSTEFLEWMLVLREEDLSHKRIDYLFANLIAEVRRSWVKRPGRIKAKDFLLQFACGAANGISRAEYIARSKSYWGLLAAESAKEK